MNDVPHTCNMVPSNEETRRSTIDSYPQYAWSKTEKTEFLRPTLRDMWSCIQETKVLEGCDENIKNQRLTCLSTKHMDLVL